MFYEIELSYNLVNEGEMEEVGVLFLSGVVDNEFLEIFNVFF